MHGSCHNFKSLFIVVALAAFSGSAIADEFDFTFSSKRSLNLRNEKLKDLIAVDANAQISIAPEFLKKHLGTTKPSSQQMKDLLTSPNRTSDQLLARKYFDANSKQTRYEYFFPVEVKHADGTITEGQMAMPAAFRMGYISLKANSVKMVRETAKVSNGPQIILENEDPTEVSNAALAEVVAEQSRVEQNAPVHPAATLLDDSLAEGQYCLECRTGTTLTSASDQTVAIRVPVAEIVKSKNPLWDEYSDFAREFSKANSSKINRNSARTYKRLFVKQLFERFGAEKAGLIIQALTAFGEAPDRDDKSTQLAELAAVIKVINNRSNSESRAESRVLRDIGVSQLADSKLSAALADWQFSVWNDGDNSLSRILSFSPDTSDAMTRRRVSMAFEAQQKIELQQIQFIGQMNNSSMHHYHADYVRPVWSSDSKRVAKAIIRVQSELGAGAGRGTAYTDVDLSKQSGARHIFYAGVP